MAQTNKRNTLAHAPLAMFQTLSQMSAQTGIPKTVLQLAQDEGCKFDHHGRYDLKDFNEWYFAQKLTPEQMENWSKRYKRAQTIDKEITIKERNRELISFVTVDQYISALVNTIFFGELDRVAQEFPPSLKGRTETEIEEIVLRQVRLIKQQLEDKLSEWDKLGAVPEKEEEQ